mmetsp:Transcript_9975/g.23391  ORF Transcript_9975/g.23391 Transcript_9975/m.23391 type:complete len:80 (-) Transcript_9975:119-358(-)
MLFALVPLDAKGKPNMSGLVGAGPLDGSNWHNADEPWGEYLQKEGNPGINESNPQGHTTWVPTDQASWPNYNVHGYGQF